ncbi:hypothetical protein CXG50_12830 [Pseudomonas plecoglossicida]|uniref:Diguanylate phosphodiesterase n=1 Tax=Pseudomonas plecoglossicida TaxID=70775 RepID=A0ABX4TYC9_PSEDL|nr:hypothetical protein CX682_18930 [Pseudomonas sp. FFUP_PS_41]PLU87016.1 hypothetical protein CXG44_12380 [Pseudomonas plecoglossicida]QKK95306.1 hypothetical protein GEV38_04485 [Pseudomonas sp. 13159349]TXH99583.1 MAG: hypothetical protein E6Q70_24595 [Pseudomonas monteilii]PLU91617.1 hypothetical protein CXG45_18670 [Pseudomonas plecoglossicida]
MAICGSCSGSIRRSTSFERPVPASSRVNPLPQVPCEVQEMRDSCGSGFTREEAGTGKNKFPGKLP